MDKKKRKILDTALSMFGNRGFHSTTMADIASSCNISKATLYKYFDSKEDFYAQAMIYMVEVLIEEIEAVDVDPALAPKEKLFQKLLLNARFLEQRMPFHILADPLHRTPQVEQTKQILTQQQERLLNLHRQGIILAYGQEIEPVSWDITLCLMGIIHEVMVMARMGYDASHEETVGFLINYLDGLVYSRRGKKPFVDADYATLHVRCKKPTIESELASLKRTAKQTLDGSDFQKAMGAITVIEKQVDDGPTDWLIIDGMLHVLQEYPGLQRPLERLRGLMPATPA